MPHNHQTHPSWRRDRDLYLKAKGNNFPILGMEIKTRTIIACCCFSALQPPSCPNSPHGTLACPMLVSLQSRAEPKGEKGWWPQACTLGAQRAGEQRVASSSITGTESCDMARDHRGEGQQGVPRNNCMDSAILGDTEPLPAAETDPWQPPTHCRHRCTKHLNFLVIELP